MRKGISPWLVSKLYRRLTQSPAFRRTGGVYLHEAWYFVLLRQMNFRPVR